MKIQQYYYECLECGFEKIPEKIYTNIMGKSQRPICPNCKNDDWMTESQRIISVQGSQNNSKVSRK